MKPSYYNNYIPFKNGTEILYNTLSGAILIVDEETKNIIENIQEAEIPEEYLNSLRQNGFIIEDNEDELLKIREIYNEQRYNPQDVSFILVPTARCNLSCDYCMQRVEDSLVEKSDQVATMSESTVKNAISFVKGVTEYQNPEMLPVAFYGGEPLMAKEQIFRILEDLQQWSGEHAFDFKPNFITNCTLFDQSVIDELHPYAVRFIRTTLDGPKEIHDHYRHYKNGKGTYEEVVTAMGLLLDAGIDVRVQLNVNRHYKQTPEMFDDLRERGLNKIKIRCIPLFDPFITVQEAQHLYGGYESFSLPESQFAIPLKDVPEASTYIYRAAFERGFELSPPSIGLQTIPCNAQKCYNYLVDPFGDVYGCMGSMLIKPMRIGHVHENGKFEKYPFFHEWMNTDPTHIEKCSSCRFLPSCGGGCVAGRQMAKIPCLCEVTFFPGGEYIKMYVEQQYPELTQ